MIKLPAMEMMQMLYGQTAIWIIIRTAGVVLVDGYIYGSNGINNNQWNGAAFIGKQAKKCWESIGKRRIYNTAEGMLIYTRKKMEMWGF